MNPQHDHLPEQILPIIRGHAGGDSGGKADTLKSLASSYLQSREHPTRLAFNHVTDTLAAAREQGFADPEINHFLSALEQYLREH